MSILIFHFGNIEDSATVNILTLVICEAYRCFLWKALYMEMLDKICIFSVFGYKKDLK